MPFAVVGSGADAINMHYRRDGNPALPCLVFSNSLGTDLTMWDAQAAALSDTFHVLRYDTRGHGLSETGRAQADLGLLGRDVLALLDHLDIARASFCGISMGGIMGQWLGVHAPERIERLILANTAACIGSPDAWRTRAEQVRTAGMDAVADGAAARWFTPGFAEREAGVVAHLVQRLRAQSPAGYAACCEALADADLRAEVASITAPTLVIAGEHDPVTKVADAVWLTAQVGGAHTVTLPASHISNIEAADAFTAALRRFMAD
jgi:3-oxoadipate enol-lactonase